MKRINVHEAKTHLSKIIATLEAEGTVIICRNNEPVAELRALPRALKRQRPWGIERAAFSVPPEFHAPLPDAELNLWES
jgi:antitoxin (DNA-binding transcriptional repressor) of toxin-antitoxin stability system